MVNTTLILLIFYQCGTGLAVRVSMCFEENAAIHLRGGDKKNMGNVDSNSSNILCKYIVFIADLCSFSTNFHSNVIKERSV